MRSITSKPIVVVGTTADYIDLIRNRHPDRAVFVTDFAERARAVEPRPPAREEVLSDLRNIGRVITALKDHLRRWNMQPAGVTCYDCESLELAAHIARSLDLSFPSPEAVGVCRNKLQSKRIWAEAGLYSPQAGVIRSPDELAQLLAQFVPPVVLKPLTGSGSELVFKCTSAAECAQALLTLQKHLIRHPNVRMYTPGHKGTAAMDSRREFVIETFIAGREYSCDVIIDEAQATIIRMAEKLPAPDQPMGTSLAYIVPGQLPPQLDRALFQAQLHMAARSVGLKRAICMVDFIVSDNRAYFLEMTPRPGGDCLPWLIQESCGLDIIGLTLEFAAGQPLRLPTDSEWQPLIGVRFFAQRAGIIRSIDDSGLKQAKCIKSYLLKARPGCRVKLPPDDYDSRILGHAIFEPQPEGSILEQCQQVNAQLSVEMEATA
jgi:biotin carboxylase